MHNDPNRSYVSVAYPGRIHRDSAHNTIPAPQVTWPGLRVIGFHREVYYLSAVVCRQSCIQPHDRISGCWFLLTFFSHSSPESVEQRFLSSPASGNRLKRRFRRRTPHLKHFIVKCPSTYSMTDVNLQPHMSPYNNWTPHNSKYDQRAKCWPFHFAKPGIFPCHIVD